MALLGQKKTKGPRDSGTEGLSVRNLPLGAVLRPLAHAAPKGMPPGAVMRPVKQGLRDEGTKGLRDSGTEGLRDQRLGATEPETGRVVMQASPRPEVNQAAATAEHPAIAEGLKAIVKGVAGAKLAGARDEKDPERIEEKIEDEGQSPRTLRDYSGFRIGVETDAARDAVEKELGRRYEVLDRQDNWEDGDEETGFHALTLQIRDEGSPVSHEVQILPREVAAHADGRHDVYEKARAGDGKAMRELKAANEADWGKYRERQGLRDSGTEGLRKTNQAAPEPIGPPAGGEIHALVKSRIAKGLPVKVFTRRVSDDPTGATRKAIEDWTEQHLGARLPVTDVKAAGDGAIYDDSSNVEHNTGRILAHSTNPHDEGKPVLVDLDGTLAVDEKTGTKGLRDSGTEATGKPLGARQRWQRKMAARKAAR